MRTKIDRLIVGMDPSFKGFGISDGKRHARFCTVPDNSLTDELDTIRRVRQLSTDITHWLSEYDAPKALWCIEAPLLRVSTFGGSHLYQLGFLMAELYRMAACDSDDGRVTEIIQVANPRLLSTLFDKRVPKDNVSGAALKAFGVLMDRDPKNDKLYAYLCYRYALGVVDGSIEHERAERRGAKSARKRANQIRHDQAYRETGGADC